MGEYGVVNFYDEASLADTNWHFFDFKGMSSGVCVVNDDSTGDLLVSFSDPTSTSPEVHFTFHPGEYLIWDRKYVYGVWLQATASPLKKRVSAW